MSYYPTEEALISHWLDLTEETFGEYAWAGPGTWAMIAQLQMHKDLIEEQDKGSIGDYIWVKPEPFAVRILMNPFAQEGRLYLAHSGTKYLAFVNL